MARLTTLLSAGLAVAFAAPLAPAVPAPAATNAAPAAAPGPAGDDGGIPTGSVKRTGDLITSLEVKDASGLTDADYQKIAQMQGLKSISFGKGFSEAGLKAIAGLPALETFTTNGADLSDATIPTLATFKNLQTLTFFHPGKRMTWTTLSSLSSLPNLQSFSVGGSTLFNDGAMAQVGQLSHLETFRTWHTGVTSDGVKALTALKGLKSITLGQRLAYTPPTTLNDDAVAVLAQIPSLESINLQEARLSLPALEKLKDLPHLTRLTLDNIDIPDADVATLKQQMPKVAIKWTPPVDNAIKRINSLFGPAGGGGPTATTAATATPVAPQPKP